MKSIYVDWMNEFGKQTWSFIGRQVLEQARGEWSPENPDGIEDDDGYPIFNYAYPVFTSDIPDEVILRVCEKTSCTMVYNEDL